MTFPHTLLGILIRENMGEAIPINSIGIQKNDEDSERVSNENRCNSYDRKTFYRCIKCGNMLNEKEMELYGNSRLKAIQYLNSDNDAIVTHLKGKCCS